MVATTTGVRADDMALEVFDLLTHFGMIVPHGRRRPDELKQIEYLTLAILQDRGTMIVGDIQRLLGVLPAQMSRIIRSLESREPSLIACQINLQDKRKVDVCLAAAGEKALQDYQSTHVGRIADSLRELPEEHLDALSHLLEKLHGRIVPRPQA